MGGEGVEEDGKGGGIFMHEAGNPSLHIQWEICTDILEGRGFLVCDYVTSLLEHVGIVSGVF